MSPKQHRRLQPKQFPRVKRKVLEPLKGPDRNTYCSVAVSCVMNVCSPIKTEISLHQHAKFEPLQQKYKEEGEGQGEVAWCLGPSAGKGDVFAPTHPAPRRGGVWEGGGLRVATGARCLGSRSILASHYKNFLPEEERQNQRQRERENTRGCACVHARERERSGQQCVRSRVCARHFLDKKI
jgi:hypothetical protein